MATQPENRRDAPSREGSGARPLLRRSQHGLHDVAGVNTSCRGLRRRAASSGQSGSARMERALGKDFPGEGRRYGGARFCAVVPVSHWKVFPSAPCRRLPAVPRTWRPRSIIPLAGPTPIPEYIPAMFPRCPVERIHVNPLSEFKPFRQRFAAALLRYAGWHTVTAEPPGPKGGYRVLSPHIQLGFRHRHALPHRRRVPAHWAAKHTVFRPPLGGLMRRMGKHSRRSPRQPRHGGRVER